MPQQQLGTLYPFVMMIIVFAFFYFFAIRPQKKREREVNAMRAALKVGDRVTTIGGIRGKVIKVNDEFVTIEVGNTRTRLEMTKWAVGTVDNADTGVPVQDTVVEEPVEEDVVDDSVTEDRGI